MNWKVVERGVAERLRLSQLYEKRRDGLTRQHEKVRQQLVTHKEKVRLNTIYSVYYQKNLLKMIFLSYFRIKQPLCKNRKVRWTLWMETRAWVMAMCPFNHSSIPFWINIITCVILLGFAQFVVISQWKEIIESHRLLSRCRYFL